MQVENSIELLSQVTLFSKLNSRQLRSLADRLIEREYQPGEAIIEQGRQGFGLFVIVSGKAEASYKDDSGNESIVNTFGPGDFFGEIALLDDEPRSASVIATKKTTCVILNRIDFVAIMMKDAEMGVVIAGELGKRIRTLLASINAN